MHRSGSHLDPAGTADPSGRRPLGSGRRLPPLDGRPAPTAEERRARMQLRASAMGLGFALAVRQILADELARRVAGGR